MPLCYHEVFAFSVQDLLMLPLKLVRILILSTHENLLPRLVPTKKLMHVNGTFILIRTLYWFQNSDRDSLCPVYEIHYLLWN